MNNAYIIYSPPPPPSQLSYYSYLVSSLGPINAFLGWAIKDHLPQAHDHTYIGSSHYHSRSRKMSGAVITNPSHSLSHLVLSFPRTLVSWVWDRKHSISDTFSFSHDVRCASLDQKWLWETANRGWHRMWHNQDFCVPDDLSSRQSIPYNFVLVHRVLTFSP